MYQNPNQFWIMKPSSSSQGKGIYITNDYNEVRDKMVELNQNSNEINTVIASHYISNPLLIDGLKCDLRIYVAVTSVDPLRIYVYDEGLTRFATQKYMPPGSNNDINNREGKFCHLTNYSLNKNNKKGFVQNTSADDECIGSKWSLKGLRKILKQNGINDAQIFHKIYDVINKTLLSVEPVLSQAFKQYVPYRTNCFQLFGFDVMIDDRLNPWLLEVNLSPSLACDSPLDQRIKGNLFSDLINLAGIVNT